ncbi:MAG: tetratricopeptide repeat protein, partial [Pyrinomonadaceae bacterium]
HVVYTDHSIPRKRSEKNHISASPHDPALVSFEKGQATPRDLGLAYAKLAVRDRRHGYFTRAFELLKQVAEEKTGDAEFLLQLGYLYDRAGNEGKAMPLYERAIRLDPSKLEAAINLGAILTAQGRHSEAVRLWEDALTRNPGLDPARINLALAHLRLGNRVSAEQALRKALEYQPDFPMARKLWSDLLRYVGN